MGIRVGKPAAPTPSLPFKEKQHEDTSSHDVCFCHACRARCWHRQPNHEHHQSRANQTKPKCSTCGTVVSVFNHSRTGFTMPDKKTNSAKTFKYRKHPSNPAYRGKAQLTIIMDDGQQKNILVRSKKNFRHGDYVQILGFSSIEHVSRKHPPST